MSSSYGRVAVYVLIVPVKYPEIVPACTNGGNGKKKEFREKESLLRKNQEARLSTKAKMEKRQQQAQQCRREIFFISKTVKILEPFRTDTNIGCNHK